MVSSWENLYLIVNQVVMVLIGQPLLQLTGVGQLEVNHIIMGLQLEGMLLWNLTAGPF